MQHCGKGHRVQKALVAVLGALSLATLALAGCGSSTTSTSAGPEQPVIAKDANGTPIVLPAKAPQRIVSLTAGDSTMLGALGIASRVVAVDVTTDYPPAMAAITPKLNLYSTSTANLVEQIIALQPDLVLNWSDFPSPSAHLDAKLEAQGLDVVDLPAEDLSGTLQEIKLVGQLVHAESTANALVASLQQRISGVQTKVKGATTPSVFVEVSYDPTYTYGSGSFGDELVRDGGGDNLFGSVTGSGGYPQVSDETVIADSPQVIILTDGADPSSVGKRPGWASIAAVKAGHVYAIDPDLVSEPGPRLVDGLEQVAKDVHPEIFGG